MIAAGIVTYNPDIEQLRLNYLQYIKNVDRLYVYDNGSDNYLAIEDLFYKEEKAFLIEGRENRGIAYGLNAIMYNAQREGISWVLTMDQDSICQTDILTKLTPYCNDNIGIVHPYTIEKEGTKKYVQKEERIEYIDFCITSASLTNVEAWNNAGGYDEWMFIDIVDFDFCAKLRELGYEIIQVNDAFLLQEVGKLKEINICKRHIYVRNHSAKRKYYFVRNILYCHYKHPHTFSFRIVIDLLLTTYLKVLLFEDCKIDKIQLMNKGFRDAYKKIYMKGEKKNEN